MTSPLAHLESLLEEIKYDIEHRKAERDHLSAKISVLEDYKHKIRLALEEERKKLPSPSGDEGSAK